MTTAPEEPAQEPAAPGAVPPPPARHSARTALLLSLAQPGAGQAYNRQWGKGAAVGGPYVVLLLVFLVLLGRGLWLFYGAATGLEDLPPLGPLFGPALYPLPILVGLHAYAVWDAWKVGHTLE